MRLHATDAEVSWRDVGWQVSYEPFDARDDDELVPLRSFTFERQQYESVVGAALERYLALSQDQVEERPAPRRRWWRRR